MLDRIRDMYQNDVQFLLNEIDQLKAENEALRKAQEWQDISTAPRDGQILVYGWPDGEISGLSNTPSAMVAEAHNGTWYLANTDGYSVNIRNITGWQPLDPPPEGEAQDE